MRNLFKITSITLAAFVILSQTAFASGKTLPVRATLEDKGYEVTWIQESKSVVIRDGGFVVEEQVGKNISLDYDTTYADESFFEDIDSKKKAYDECFTNATVKEVGENYFIADTERLGEVWFTVDEKTHIHHERNKMLYMISDIEPGMAICVNINDSIAPEFLPPRTYAREVIVTDSAEEAVKTLTTSGSVVETGDNYFTVKTQDGNIIQFNVDENTHVHHVINRMRYVFEDIEEGMEVSVNHSEAMTLSLPPQCYAIEVIIK